MEYDFDFKNSILATSKKIDVIKDSVDMGDVSVEQLLDMLLADGIHIMVIILIAPFLIPVSIPGSSTPFGILIILLELSVLFNKKLVLPKMVSEYTLSEESMNKLFEVLYKAMSYIEKISKPRGNLTKNKVLNKLNSVIIIVLAVLLFLPLPIPFTDFIPAVSILLLSVSCLEDDSYLLILGYIASIFTMGYFASVGYIGVEIIKNVIYYILSFI
ncbi:MAG: exopolysaccharide biosynthesis protein [Methanosphaera sp.]|nr:exopolysaccharide biosynthesis protein [Methanosphaera sp.]